MTLDMFISVAMTWTLFPPEVRDTAINDAYFLVGADRLILAAKLDSIHVACKRIEAQRYMNFADAQKDLDEIRRAVLPVLFAKAESDERAEALQNIAKQFE